ncbi:MAG: hypothetical protein Q9160_008433 [Pyrenula sp. 1 TL-2023]
MPSPATDGDTSREDQSGRLTESRSSPLREVKPLHPELESDRPEHLSAASGHPSPNISETVSVETHVEVESKESSHEDSEKIVEAVHAGDVAEVKRLLDRGIGIETRDSDGDTLLHVAVDASRESVVKFLLENGANIGARDSEGLEALHIATCIGKTANICLLLDHGASVNAKTKTGSTALVFAVSREYKSVVELLLANGADVDSRDEDGLGSLHLAAYAGYAGMVRLLLDYGANIYAHDNEGRAPLHIALYKGNQAVVELLLERGADIGTRIIKGMEPLHVAAGLGHTGIVELLLNRGANIDAQDNEGWTPLQHAVRHRAPEEVQLLLAHGASVNLADEDGWTPLHEWRSSENEQMTRLLLDYGADIRAITDAGHTPLHHACKHGRIEMARVLLDHRAKVDVTDHKGWTALHLASSESHGAIVQLLLAKGADARLLTGNTHQSALLLCIIPQKNAEGENESKASRKLALEGLAKKADLRQKEFALSKTTTQEDLEILTDVRHANRSDQSGLEELKVKWFAERRDKHDLVCDLLTCQDISIPQKPHTALQWAAYHGKPDIVWRLLKTTKPDKKADADRYEATRIATSRRASPLQNKKNPTRSRNDMKFEQVKESGGRRDGDKGIFKAVPQNERSLGRLVTDQVPKPDQEREDKFSLTLDMLRDPPLVVGMSDLDELYDMPAIEQSLAERIIEYEATIVDFYRRGGRMNFLRRSRPVFNVIYDNKAGAERIMYEAMKRLEKISPEAAKEKHYYGDERQLRWIHLPANNMTWMQVIRTRNPAAEREANQNSQDLAKRIFYDKGRSKEEYLRLSDFIRKSWQELPAGASAGKFMKPACLKEGVKRRGAQIASSANEAPQTFTEQSQKDQGNIRKASNDESGVYSPEPCNAVEEEKEKDATESLREYSVEEQAEDLCKVKEQAAVEGPEKGPIEKQGEELIQEQAQDPIKTTKNCETGSESQYVPSVKLGVSPTASKPPSVSSPVKSADPKAGMLLPFQA